MMVERNLFSSKRLVFILVLLLWYSFFIAEKSILTIPDNGSITEKQKTREKAPPPPADIAINRDSTYALSDISNIIHVPSETRIEIHLNATRRCQNPVFKGRISGWSLSMIEFDNVSDDVVVGKYDLFHMPRSGKYYVEILIVLCEGYGDAYQFLDLRKVSIEVNQDGRHQITAGNGNATIDIDTSVQNQNLASQATKIRGRWLHKSLVTIQKTLVTDENLTQPEPLFTAVQCRGTKELCENMDGRKTILNEYTFLWNSGPDAVLHQPGLSGMIQTQQQHQQQSELLGGNISDGETSKPPEHSTDVCFLGASHSRELTSMCNDILKTTREIAERQNLESPLLDGFYCRHINLQYPVIENENGSEYMKAGQIVHMGRFGCTHVVVGLFQWYFSYENFRHPNLTFSEWKSGMTKTVQLFQTADQSSIRKVWLRSAHPNGFNKRHTNQSPDDFRTPVNSKLATQIIQEIVNELETTDKNESKRLPSISVMDTDVVMDPVWDAAPDWSHYKGQFEEAETKFILSTIVNDDRLQTL